MEYLIIYLITAILLAIGLSTLDKLNELPCSWGDVDTVFIPVLWPIAVPVIALIALINISSTYLSNLIRNYYERNSNPKH